MMIAMAGPARHQLTTRKRQSKVMSPVPPDNDELDTIAAKLQAWLRSLEGQLRRLLNSPVIRFDDRCHSALPKAHGIYRIFDPAKPDETVRAGRTKTAARGLRQRVYQNHLMGNQTGNLRAQLVADRVCSDLEAAKRFMRDKLAVQVLVVEDAEERAWRAQTALL